MAVQPLPITWVASAAPVLAIPSGLAEPLPCNDFPPVPGGTGCCLRMFRPCSASARSELTLVPGGGVKRKTEAGGLGEGRVGRAGLGAGGWGEAEDGDRRLRERPGGQAGLERWVVMPLGEDLDPQRNVRC